MNSNVFCLSTAVLVIGLLSALPAGAQSFSEQTTTAGLNFTTFVAPDVLFGEHYPGGAVGDFNRDGWPDIFVLGGGGGGTSMRGPSPGGGGGPSQGQGPSTGLPPSLLASAPLPSSPSHAVVTKIISAIAARIVLLLWA